MIERPRPNIKPKVWRRCMKFAKKACEKMDEPNQIGVAKVAYITGPQKAIEFVKLAIEKQTSDTPILRKDGKPKTVGGAYFFLSFGYMFAEKREEYGKYKYWLRNWSTKAMKKQRARLIAEKNQSKSQKESNKN